MPVASSLFLSVACSAAGGTLTVTYTPDPNEVGGVAMQYYLELTGSSGARAPISSNGDSADFPGLLDGVYNVRLLDANVAVLVVSDPVEVDCGGNGGGGVTCDLELTNLQLTQPTVAGGTGNVSLIASTSYPPLVYTVTRLSPLPELSQQLATSQAGVVALASVPIGRYRFAAKDSRDCEAFIEYEVLAPATPPPAPLPTLPAPPPQNLETFPFSREGEPYVDSVSAACAEQPYYVVCPSDSFLPFSLRRVKQDDRWLDCAQLLDARTEQVLLTFDPRELNYLPSRDGTYDYFVYTGGPVTVNIPTCRPLRLRIDEFTSVPFIAYDDVSTYLLAKWWHPRSLYHLPYGSGLEQHLYVQNATLREEPVREEKTETKNAKTGAIRVDFLAQAHTVSFDTEPLPAWLVQAVVSSKLHDAFSAGSFARGAHPVREVKQTVFGETCQRTLTVTLEHDPAVVVGCAGVPAPVLRSLPADYPMNC